MLVAGRQHGEYFEIPTEHVVALIKRHGLFKMDNLTDAKDPTFLVFNDDLTPFYVKADIDEWVSAQPSQQFPNLLKEALRDSNKLESLKTSVLSAEQAGFSSVRLFQVNGIMVGVDEEERRDVHEVFCFSAREAEIYARIKASKNQRQRFLVSTVVDAQTRFEHSPASPGQLQHPTFSEALEFILSKTSGLVECPLTLATHHALSCSLEGNENAQLSSVKQFSFSEFIDQMYFNIDDDINLKGVGYKDNAVERSFNTDNTDGVSELVFQNWPLLASFENGCYSDSSDNTINGKLSRGLFNLVAHARQLVEFDGSQSDRDHISVMSAFLHLCGAKLNALTATDAAPQKIENSVLS
jgi:hypothetical protein